MCIIGSDVTSISLRRGSCSCSPLPVSVRLCTQVLKFQEAQSRVSASNDFFRGLSREADLVMDGDLLMVRNPEKNISHHPRLTSCCAGFWCDACFTPPFCTCMYSKEASFEGIPRLQLVPSHPTLYAYLIMFPAGGRRRQARPRSPRSRRREGSWQKGEPARRAIGGRGAADARGEKHVRAPPVKFRWL